MDDFQLKKFDTFKTTLVYTLFDMIGTHIRKEGIKKIGIVLVYFPSNYFLRKPSYWLISVGRC